MESCARSGAHPGVAGHKHSVETIRVRCDEAERAAASALFKVMRGVLGQIGRDVFRFAAAEGYSRVVADLVAALVAQVVYILAVRRDGAVEDAGRIIGQLRQFVGIAVPGVELIDAVFIAADEPRAGFCAARRDQLMDGARKRCFQGASVFRLSGLRKVDSSRCNGDARMIGVD